MSNQKIEIKAAEGTSEIIIREGTALGVFNPKVVGIDGTIDAPYRFIKNRVEEIKPHKQCNIRIALELGIITLAIAEKDPFGTTITGKLTINKDVTGFQINDGRYVLPEDLATFLRTRKHLFKSPDTYNSVFVGLRTFTAKVQQAISAIRSDTGDYESKKTQAVEHNIPKVFTLSLPIFKGMPKIDFEVEILVDKNLNVTMYSSELIQKDAELTALYLEDQVKAITEIAPEIVIINV